MRIFYYWRRVATMMSMLGLLAMVAGPFPPAAFRTRERAGPIGRPDAMDAGKARICRNEDGRPGYPAARIRYRSKAGKAQSPAKGLTLGIRSGSAFC